MRKGALGNYQQGVFFSPFVASLADGLPSLSEEHNHWLWWSGSGYTILSKHDDWERWTSLSLSLSLIRVSGFREELLGDHHGCDIYETDSVAYLTVV